MSHSLSPKAFCLFTRMKGPFIILVSMERSPSMYKCRVYIMGTTPTNILLLLFLFTYKLIQLFLGSIYFRLQVKRSTLFYCIGQKVFIILLFSVKKKRNKRFGYFFNKRKYQKKTETKQTC
jgi:hypothetical protein